MNKKTALAAAGLLVGLGAGWSLGARLERGRYSFFGRTVVITGGSRGLGLVMARMFAQEGAHLALLARDENELRRAAAELTAQGAAVLTIPCDIRNRSQVETAIANIASHYGSIDVLINNAGIIQMGPLDSMTV